MIALSLGLAGATSSVWFALLGAAAASVAVYAIGTAGRGGATPVRLALAGTAITAALTAVIYGVALADQKLLQQYNFWAVGALGGRGRTQLESVAAVHRARDADRAGCSPARSTRSRSGDDSARSLGAHVGRTRIGGAVAVTLLCGAATAAAGPMYFLGLTVPHAARALCGPDQRWVLAYSAVLGGALLLFADVDRAGDRAAGRAAGRRDDGHRRHAAVHRARAPQADRPAVSAARTLRARRVGLAARPPAVARARLDPGRGRARPGDLRDRHRRVRDPARHRDQHAARRRRRAARSSSSTRCACRACCARCWWAARSGSRARSSSR